MKSKLYSTIAIAAILAFALIATTTPTLITPVSAISHEGGNMTQDGNMNGGGMADNQMGEDTGTMDEGQ
jgi:hypothetical protein